MHQLPFEQQLLALAQALALVVLCVRLWLARLHRVYPFFFTYLLANFFQICLPLLVPFDSMLYRDLWLVTESLLICFYVLVVLELYSIVLQGMVGIASLS